MAFHARVSDWDQHSWSHKQLINNSQIIYINIMGDVFSANFKAAYTYLKTLIHLLRTT